MSNFAIRTEGLSKLYRIGERQQTYRTLLDTVSDAFARPFRAMRRKGSRAPRESRVWALKDVTFEVKKGEIVGIIGRNGAGKSTLLKVLSRITEPTRGTLCSSCHTLPLRASHLFCNSARGRVLTGGQ